MRMVSITSVERPESMRWSPSGARPTVSRSLVRGERLSSEPGTVGSLQIRISYVLPSKRDTVPSLQTILRQEKNGATNITHKPSRWTLGRTPRSRPTGGNAYRCSLGHVCTTFSPISQTSLPYGLHHLRMESPITGPQPLPGHDVCSHINVPWWPLRSVRKCLSAKNNALISRQLMYQEK